MSDTPRVDAFLTELHDDHTAWQHSVTALARFARQLERELAEARAEYERLERTVKFMEKTYLDQHGGSWGVCKYQAELAEARRDAERYRWLRDVRSDDDYRVYIGTAIDKKTWRQLWGPELDVAIDAAIARAS